MSIMFLIHNQTKGFTTEKEMKQWTVLGLVEGSRSRFQWRRYFGGFRESRVGFNLIK